MCGVNVSVFLGRSLYRLVQQHQETYLALAREGDGDGHAIPGYVEHELRRYLECGILAYG